MSRMSKAWKVTLSIIAGVLLLFAIAEGGIRAFISHQVTSQAPEGTSVSFGAKPVTLGLLGGKFPHMTVDQQSTLVVDGNQFTGNPAAVVEMDNVRVAGNDPVAEELHMTTTLPNEYVRAMLNQQLEEQIGDQGFLSNLITVSAVTANPEKETFTIEFTGGLAGIELRPTMRDGQLALEAENTALFGFDLPDEVADAVSDALSQGVEGNTVGTMRVDDFQVVPGGIQITLAGTDVNFNELQMMTEQPQQVETRSS